MKTLEEVTAELNALQGRLTEAADAAEKDDSKVEEVKALVEELKPQIDVLSKERQEAIQREEVKSLKTKLETLDGVINELKKPAGEFTLPVGEHSEEEIAEGKALPENDPYADGTISVYNDIRLANKNVAEPASV